MTTERPIKVQIDGESEVAYVRFTDGAVRRTRCLREDINIDLDEYGIVVGIELLDLDADIPFQQLITDFHVPGSQVETLRLIRPNMTSFVDRHTGGHATSATGAMQPC